jgi:hypothetical protein
MDYGSTEPLPKGWTNDGFPPITDAQRHPPNPPDAAKSVTDESRIPYGDGSFVHAGPAGSTARPLRVTMSCATICAQRRQAAAAAALREFGIRPPASLP